VTSVLMLLLRDECIVTEKKLCESGHFLLRF